MDRNGFWIKLSITTGEPVSLIKVENDIEDSYWDFNTNTFVRLVSPRMEITMDDDYDNVSEEEALRLLGRTSWENE